MPWIISLALLAADPCALASDECRSEVGDALLSYESALAICDVRLDAARARLDARTATAALGWPQPVASATPGPTAERQYMIGGVVGAALGVLMGILVTR